MLMSGISFARYFVVWRQRSLLSLVMDPEVRALEGGAKVARLRIATTERIYNRQTQETKEHTEWHTVTLW